MSLCSLLCFIHSLPESSRYFHPFTQRLNGKIHSKPYGFLVCWITSPGAFLITYLYYSDGLFQFYIFTYINNRSSRVEGEPNTHTIMILFLNSMFAWLLDGFSNCS
jgi:hypothetical protein